MATLDTSATFRRAEASPKRFPVNLRITIPFYPKPLFVTLIVGREKRSLDRRRVERDRHPIQTWGNLLALAATWGVVSIAALFAVLVITAL